MLSPEQEDRLRGLLRTEKTLTEIASEMGMSYHTLRIQLGESGLRLEITRSLIDVKAEQRDRLRREPLPGSKVLVLPGDGGRPYHYIHPDGPPIYDDETPQPVAV